MNESALRDRLRAEIESIEAPPNPRVEPVLARGRIRRRVRHSALAAGGSVAAIAAVVALTQIGLGIDAADPARPSEPAAGGPNQAADDPPYQQIADRLDAVTRSHVPGLPLRTDDIYPSDWTRNTALPAEQWRQATDWHALFTVTAASGDQDLWVSAMYSAPGDRLSIDSDVHYCATQESTRCEIEGTSNAWTVTDELVSSADGADTYWLRVRAVRDGGGYSNLVRIGVHATSLQQAREIWAVDIAALRAVATDPDLTIPPPAA